MGCSTSKAASFASTKRPRRLWRKSPNSSKACTDVYFGACCECECFQGRRPALSLKQLTYKPEQDLVVYRPTKGRPDSPAVLRWSGVEFVARLAALIPPARKHLVRYYGALGPRSPLRRAVSRVARQKANAEELRAGYSTTLPASVARAARKAAAAASRSWAACLRKIFEVYPVLCVKCGGEMTIVAVIMDDAQLDRILASQG